MKSKIIMEIAEWIFLSMLLTGCTAAPISDYPMPWGDSVIDQHGIATEVFGGFAPQGGFDFE